MKRPLYKDPAAPVEARVQDLLARMTLEEQAEQLFARAIFDDALIHAGNPGARSAVLARAAVVLGEEVAQDIAEVLGFDEEVA